MVKLIQFLKDSLLVFISLFLTSSAVTAQIGDTIVSLTPTYRNVLLEEYTGVGCSWCPDGHRMANELAAELPGQVNIINIHTGYLAYNTYTTQFGTALADQTNLDGYPSGTINRHVFSGSGTALNRGYWRSAAYQISQITSPVNIAAEGTLDYATRTLHVRIQLYYTGAQSVTSNALNLAIIQDNVLGAQNGMDLNPSQIVDGQYNHMHMLRHLVTGQWGETIYTVSQGTLVEKTYDYVIPEQLGSPNPINAVLDNLRFIAFVCEGHQEVLTSIEVPIQRINLPAINGALLSVNELENVECNEHGNAYFEFQNKGANTVTSLVYTYMVNNGAVQTVTWNGNIPSWGTDTIHTPILNLNLNTINTVTVQVNAINGVNVNLTSKSGTIKKNVSSCGGDMTFTLVTDRYASETTFKIFDPEGNVVLSGGPWANLSYNGTTTHTYSFEPQIGGCHRLEVYDLYGDGINSGFGAGYFMMIQNEGNVELFLDNGQFGEKATYMIDISTQTPPCTTVYSEFYNTACDNYTWYGATYTQSGDYTHTFTNASGCDSVVTLHLTLKHSETVEYAETACDSYIWNDSVYTQSGDYVQTFTATSGCDSIVTLHLIVTESPALQAISGEAGVCRNQFATYRYDISNLDYQYKWFKDNVLWTENVPEVTLHEMNEGFVLLTMQVSDEQSGCAADTSLTIHVLDHIAPNTTEIQRKPNSNILLCQSVTSDYGTVHYRWGYTDLLTYEEVIMPGDNNYCFYDIGIDTFAYLYWVETYLDGPIGSGCENRSYYGHDVTTYTSDYDTNVVDAYMYGNCIVLNVSSLSVEDISATLYNVNGKLMLTRKYGHTDSVSDNIPVSFAPGVYFLKVSVGSKLYSFKLLKI